MIGFDRVELPFNSRMTEILQGSDYNEIVNKMFAHMRTQIKNSALRNSRFVFDKVLFLDVNFHQLNLTRASSYIPLPSWIESKKAVINPENEDDECFKWAFIAGLHYKEIKSHPERVSNLKRFANNYDWSELEFPVATNKINEFEKNNKDIAVNALGVKDQRPYPLRKSKHKDRKNVYLLLITDGEKTHYTTIKSLSRLLGNSNSKHGHKQHFCISCLQGFTVTTTKQCE